MTRAPVDGDDDAAVLMQNGAAPDFVGVSPVVRRLREEIHAIASSGFRAVLIQGESGAGKEVAAEALRRASARRVRAYEIFDCPAVPEDHLESELFGTTRGAFPGAIDKRGALERAHAGTIFFDEIAAMRLEHQAKMLRVIEGKTFRRVGGSTGVVVDVAVIAAAHEDLSALAARGAFRHDLYYRLIRDGVLIVPALRDRLEDVPLLARQYVCAQLGRDDLTFETAALARLAEYDWPGNVRQLHSALRVAIRLDPRALTLAAVDEALGRFARDARAEGAARPVGMVAERLSPVRASLDEGRLADFHAITASTQRRALLQAYEAAAGNKTAAGVLLGFHLSPGETQISGRPLTESRRNLALRKFRYWASRLGLTDALARRASTVRALEVRASIAAVSSDE